jgi:hypothetical protein
MFLLSFVYVIKFGFSTRSLPKKKKEEKEKERSQNAKL